MTERKFNTRYLVWAELTC